MDVVKLPLETQALLGANYAAIIDYTDLSDTAGLTKTLTTNIPANAMVQGVCHTLIEDFVSATASSLVYTVGDGSDADFHLTSTQLEQSDTEIDLKVHTPGSGASAEGKVYTAADTLDFAFTAVGGNLNTLTAGKLIFYFRMVTLDELKRI